VPDSINQRLEAWLRYADDLRLGPYFRNRALQPAPDASVPRSESSSESLVGGRSFSSDI